MATARRLIVRDIASLVGSNMVVRVGTFVLFLVLTVTTRSLSSVNYAMTFTIITVSQLLLNFDLGIGSLVVDLSARGGDPGRVLQLVGPLRRRLRTVLMVGMPMLAVGEYAALLRHRPGHSVQLGLAVVIATQVLLLGGTLVLNPYERVLFGARAGFLLSKAAAVGLAGSFAVLLLTEWFPDGVVPCIVISAALGGPMLSRLISRRNVKATAGPTSSDQHHLSIAPAELARARMFWWLQICGMAAFGIDQLVVSTFRSSAEAASFGAHARYFLLGGSGLAVMVNSLWPPIASALSRRDVHVAQRTYVMAGQAVVGVSLLWCAPILLGLVPVSLFKDGERSDLSLLVPMSISFVLLQVGTLVGQVQAALRDLAFQLRTGAIMAVLNVVSSVVLCVRIGPVGVVWGTVITYPLVVLGPALWRLARTALWMRSESANF